MNVLITRQIDQSKKFSSLLNEKNIKNVVFPTIHIKNIALTKENIKDIEKADFIIFTSQNAVSSIKKDLSLKRFFKLIHQLTLVIISDLDWQLKTITFLRLLAKEVRV